MVTHITENNLAALAPLYKPWEEPLQHRVRNEVPDSPAIIQPGRRPSRCPLVRGIRAEVDGWRRGGYAGASTTTRTLLNHWFNEEHSIKQADGAVLPFSYYWAQREAIETVIYLYELRGIRSVASLLSEFGSEAVKMLALGIMPDDDRWPKDCCKVATGGGKTKVMSLAVVWSFFNSLYEPGSELAKHFVIIAPNLIVYERLRNDFEKCVVFDQDPLIPPEWKHDFQMQVVLQDEPGGSSSTGTIYLTNIHRLYDSRANGSAEDDDSPASTILGPEVRRARALDTSSALRERISAHPRLMIMNDEAHHLHDPELAWNKALDALHTQSLGRGKAGICLQLDFTATPKHTDGALFNHIVCDFPLGEAVDAGIVKVPVLGESDQLTVYGDDHTPAHERYKMHLKLGYERYKSKYEELQGTRKPILFVMTEDTEAANEIADYLDNEAFPLLKGRVLNLHTRLKGRVKKVKRGGKDVFEFIESEDNIKPEDLSAVRQMSRDLDKEDSPYRCVVSVMMLREGWDVRNVTTIIPLRVYSAKAGILPEQTLGRGLRRMYPNGDVPESVVVVHHPAFRKLYEEELAQEGLDIAVLPITTALKQSVSIFVDTTNKPVADLEIEVPAVTDAIEATAELQGLTAEDVEQFFDSHFKPLPIGQKGNEFIDYKERHLFTDEVVTRLQIDAGLLANAWSASAYFSQMLSRACHLTNQHAILTPLLEHFISQVLFEHPVDLFAGEVDHRMRDLDVMEHIRATFTPLILERTVKQVARKQTAQVECLSKWLPYQASATDKRPAVPATRTMFNLVPCENSFEQEFADYCDNAPDLQAFAKNAGPQKLMIDYLKPDGNGALYVPDFVVRLKNGCYLLVELKGKVDELVPFKARAAMEWCKAASMAKWEWSYLYVPYSLFQGAALTSLEELERACLPSLNELVKEAKTGQLALPIFEKSAQAAVDKNVTEMLARAGITQLPPELVEVVRQSINLLDHSIRMKMPQLAPAFQPLLKPLDDLSIRIIENRLKPLVPAEFNTRKAYFEPYLDNIGREKALLQRNQRYLQDNLIYGRSIQRIGTLLFCLDYAQNQWPDADGVWNDVRSTFSGPAMLLLYQELRLVNDFRNTRVAHVEETLDDAEQARANMIIWLRCLKYMVEIAA